jgi:hypothetical protein
VAIQIHRRRRGDKPESRPVGMVNRKYMKNSHFQDSGVNHYKKERRDRT